MKKDVNLKVTKKNSPVRIPKKAKQKTTETIIETQIQKISFTDEERRKMISEQAYLISEKCGFDSAQTESNWLEAEKQVDLNVSEFLFCVIPDIELSGNVYQEH